MCIVIIIVVIIVTVIVIIGIWIWVGGGVPGSAGSFPDIRSQHFLVLV